MAEVPTEEVGTGSSTEGDISDQQQQCLSSESLAEWRSSEQLENGTPSASPPYWDTDDDDGGPKPVELYGKYTWKINKFSQINKRELRSDPFEIGGYKWYILIYPQGCDVCNHLSLFLCVANHDKLLPGWSHFAQFTIAVVNKDPKKSKYSDTLHRFWKKEHDWGWKKFMELSKVFDGFIDSDTLIIKAQVQVIRERADRPFRCLDCQYRRELIRVYLTNVEQVCRRFVEERRNKLGKLIEDKVRWSSFCAFWRSMDPRSRCHMSQEKTESILKVVVKHFFTEKEVTSTLVMDSLYSGLKALEGPYKGRKNKSKFLDSEDLPIPIIRMEKDIFVLDDDVLPLLQRAATAPLPPKDDTGPQNRSKDGAVGGEFNKDCVERDEKRLTELGRWTIEIFILAHMFSKIEVAYQEAVALKKQEELIREEEAAWHAGNDHRSRRGAADKEKKPKKKQGKQKRNSRKGKDKARDERARCILQMEMEQDRFSVKSEDVVDSNEAIEEKCVAPADVSDVSDSVDCAPEKIPAYSDDRDVSPVNWDTDTSEAHPPPEASNSGVTGLSTVQNGTKEKSSIADDSSSTSSDLISSMPQISKSQLNKSKKPARRRGRSHNVKQIFDSSDLIGQENNHPSEGAHVAGQPKHVGGTSKSNGIAPTAFVHASHDIIVNGFEHPVVKEEEASFGHKNVSVKDPNAEASEVTSTVSKEVPSPATQKLVKVDVSSSSVIRKKSSSDSPKKSNTPTSSAKSVENVVASKTNIQKCTAPKATEKTSRDAVHLRSEKAQPASVTMDKLAVPPVPIVSRPCSAPIVPSSKVNVSTLPMAPTSPALARSASVAGRLSPESFTSAAQSYVPLSYRNAMMGGPASGSSRPYSTIQSSTAVVNSSVPYTQGAPLVSAPMFAQYGSDRMDMNQLKTALPFGMLNHDPLQQSRSLQLDSSQRDGIRNLPGEVAPQSRSQDKPSRNIHVSPEEFPHLDIINDLLDDENGVMDTSIPESDYQSFRNTHNRPHFASNLYGFLDDTALSSGAGPSTGLCRFKSAPSPIDERFQYSYPDGTSSEALQDMIPHSSLHPYDNGQLGLVPNQCLVSGSERPFLNTRSSDDTYLYHLLEYQNMGTGSSGFPGYRSSNGL